MSVTEIEMIKACVKTPIYTKEIFNELLQLQSEGGPDEKEANARKELTKLFYKVWSGFSKYIKSQCK